MPVNYIQIVFSVLAAALGIALLITLVAFGATIFALAFVYVFIPLLIIATARWLWLKYRLKTQEKITYFPPEDK